MGNSLPLRAAALALLLGTLAACNNDSAPNDEPTASTEPINQQALQAAGFVSLARGLPIAEDKIPASGEMVFRTAAEWQAVWARQRPGTEVDTPPQVDFGKFMVVGISGDIVGCRGIGISKAELSASALTVHRWYGSPPPKELNICPHLMYRDDQLVLVPQSSLPVQFVERKWEEANPAWSPQLHLQAEPYENRMPQATSNGSPACTQLIVPFAVRAAEGSLPQSLKVNAVAVTQDGVTRWLQPASASETGINQGLISDSDWLHDAAAGAAGIRAEPVLRGVARGCTSPQFKLDQPVRVLLSVAAADGQAELAADATLTAVY